jgi:hypothetical protein
LIPILSKRIGLLRRIRPFNESFIITPSSNQLCYIVVQSGHALLRITLTKSLNYKSDAQRTANSVDLFNRLKWIPFYEEASIKRCAVCINWLNGEVPAYMDELLMTDNHGRNTRFCQLNLRCPSYKHETEGGKTFSVRTAKEWYWTWTQIAKLQRH